MAEPPERSQAFRKLQATFVEGLSARALEIETASGEELRLALHRLAGAAGVFRFDELGQAARTAEMALRGDPAQPASIAAPVLALIRQAQADFGTLG